MFSEATWKNIRLAAALVGLGILLAIALSPLRAHSEEGCGQYPAVAVVEEEMKGLVASLPGATGERIEGPKAQALVKLLKDDPDVVWNEDLSEVDEIIFLSVGGSTQIAFAEKGCSPFSLMYPRDEWEALLAKVEVKADAAGQR